MLDYKEIITNYKDVPGGILEAYHAIQKEINYIPEEAILAAAEVFDIPAKDAYEVVSFYSYFSCKPRGKYVIRICESAPCHLTGADDVIAGLEKELGIKMGETTADGNFTLEFTECVGQCQETPVITINGKPYGIITADSIAGIIAEYK